MPANKLNRGETMATSFPKINKAIEDSFDAISKASRADENSNSALTRAKSVQTQLDTIVIEGDSSVEAAQARVNEKGEKSATLKERLDKGDRKVLETADKKMNIAEDVYYDEVSVQRLQDPETKTTYFLTKIPKYDKNNQLIKIKRGFSANRYDSKVLETPREFANRNAATVVINSSTFSNDGVYSVGTGIYNGTIQQERARQPYNYILGMKNDNTMKAFLPSTPAQEILNQGYTNALTAFIPLIEGGKSVSDSVIATREVFAERHPRQAVGQDAAGNTYFFTSEGRRAGEIGLTAKDTIRLLLTHQLTFAYMLDGGGSTQLVYYDTTLNKYSDDNGKTERSMVDFLYVGKDNPDKSVNEALKSVGTMNKVTNDVLADLEVGLTYTPSNHVPLGEYLINGWKNYGTAGSSICRGWRLNNNLLYLVGTIHDGDPNEPFMKLPDTMKPMFTYHFLTPGNSLGEIYKIIAGSDGYLKMYYWSEEARQQTDYIKLDGLIIPVMPL